MHIVVPQSTQHVEEIEQRNDNITPFQEHITTKNIVEPPYNYIFTGHEK